MDNNNARLRGLFIGRSRGEQAEMSRALESGDLEVVGATAHRMAGAAGAFGLPAVEAAARELERQCIASDAAGARGALARVRDELARIDHPGGDAGPPSCE